MTTSTDGPAAYGPGWSVGACEIEACRYCADGWIGTCKRCGGRTTHQPMWEDQPQEWQVEVCPKCGYAINPTGFGGFAEGAYYVSPDGKISKADHPDNLAMRILKGLEIVDDHPQPTCAVPACGQTYASTVRTDCPESAVDSVRQQGIRVTGGEQGMWDAEVPLCALHAYQRWYPSIGADGGVTFRVFGPPGR